MIKKIIFFLSIVYVFSPVCLFAQINENGSLIISTIFKARVIKILEEKVLEREGGTKAVQQNILLRGLYDEWKGKEVVHNGISEMDVLSSNAYKEGDTVLVNHVQTVDGQDTYYIVEYVRSGYLYFLAILFVCIILVIGRMKGFRALISLIFSFLVILKFIIPQILQGNNPVMVSFIGALFMIVCIIYFTEGWNRKSHVAIASVMISLLITIILSWIFSGLTRLTGMAQEDTIFLINIGQTIINFKGLLLAGIIIGTIGVLDDVVVSQVEAVVQIRRANPSLSFWDVFKGAYQIGNTHLGSMINTLFLTYAGVSLPILMLFSIGREPFVQFSSVINNELVATEIVRTLVGSIGLACSVPISTFFAVVWCKEKVERK